MVSLPNLLSNIIHEKFIVHLNNNRFELEEKNADVKFEFIVPKDSEIICLQFDISDEVLKSQTDTFDFIFPYFKIQESYNGLRTKNDYIVVYQKDEKIYVFLMELKSNDSGYYKHQLDSGELFFKFLIDRMNRALNTQKWNDASEFNKSNFYYKRILFKKNGKTQPSKIEPDIDNYYRLPYRNYHLKNFF